MNTVEKTFNPYFFLGLNVVIIILSETAGGGLFFIDTGIIHVIAIGFLVLAALRVFFHYYTYDPFLEKFIHTALAAMGVFAISHIVEFVSFMVFHQHNDTVYTNVANMYLISILLIIIGAESFLRMLQGRSVVLMRILIGLVLALAAYSIYLLIQGRIISPDTTIAAILYSATTFVSIAVGLWKMRQIRHAIKFMHGFVDYLSISLVLIALAVLPNIFYDLIVEKFGVVEYQVIYLSHFTFYAALSVLFLAFGKVSRLGGALEEVKNIDLQKKR